MRPEDLGIGSRLFERVRDAVVVADAETGRVVLWNPAAVQVFGYPVFEALVPGYPEAQLRGSTRRDGASGPGPHAVSHELQEFSALRKGGEEIYVEVSLSPVEAEGGGGSSVLAIARDVTGRKKAEEELEESEQRFKRSWPRSLPNQMGDARRRRLPGVVRQSCSRPGNLRCCERSL